MQNKATNTVAIRGMLVIMSALLLAIIILATVTYVRHRNDNEEESTTESAESTITGSGDTHNPNGDNLTDVDDLLGNS